MSTVAAMLAGNSEEVPEQDRPAIVRTRLHPHVDRVVRQKTRK